MSTTDLQDIILDWESAGVSVDVMHRHLIGMGMSTEAACTLLTLTLF